jgi:hypothetical protein
MKNQQTPSTPLVSQSHQKPTTTSMNQANPTRFTSQPQLNGLATMKPQPRASSTMNNPPKNTIQSKNHLHTSHTTTTNHLPKSTIHMSQPFKPGPLTTNSHPSPSTGTMNPQAPTMKNQSHPQQLNITTKNHQPLHTSLMNHLQFNGPPTTKNQPSNSTPMSHQLKNIHMFPNHPHT